MRLTRSGRTRGVVIGLVAAMAMGCAAPPPGPQLAPGLVAAPAGTPTTSVAALFAGRDYQESEHFLAGTARTSRRVDQWSIDGRWEKAVNQQDRPFTTRLLVARPSDPSRFNGTVWVEWLNVTAQFDLAVSVVQARDQIVESGAAWVGVSAQRAGVDLLRATSPRYDSLSLATDALSYDVFSAAARAVREHADLFGGVPARTVIGVGDSQSAVRLTTYVNAWAPVEDSFDGFVIQSRFTSGAPIGAGVLMTTPTLIRDDAPQPVLQLQTESEVAMDLDAIFPGIGTWPDVRQPDAGNVRTWEVPGAAHADRYLISGAAPAVPIARPSGPCGAPLNDFPMRYVASAAFTAVERWVRDGEPPPTAPPISTVGRRVQRDAHGNALGGVRLPDIDVPIARHNTNVDFRNPICALFGSTRLFDAGTLRAGCGSSAEYVDAYTRRADEAVSAGFLRPQDRDRAIAQAASIPFPP